MTHKTLIVIQVVHLQESQQNDRNFDDEDDHTDENGEPAKSSLFIVETAPNRGPVDNPDEVDNERDGHEVPQSCFLLNVSVVPEQEDEGEQGQVVVWSFEVGQQGQHDHCHEHFVNVLDHL